MADQQIEQCFKSVVEAAWQVLKPLGFRKQGQRFSRLSDGNVAIIEFQRSQSSDSRHIKFTLNLGVVSGLLSNRLDPERGMEKVGVADAHLRQRIGTLLPSKDDLWWQVLVATDNVRLRAEVVETIMGYAVPYLNSVGHDESLIALWRADQSPGLTNGQRQRYLAILAS